MKNNLNNNSELIESKKIDWSVVQKEMKNNFGSDIYESWLKKINFVEGNTVFDILQDLHILKPVKIKFCNTLSSFLKHSSQVSSGSSSFFNSLFFKFLIIIS